MNAERNRRKYWRQLTMNKKICLIMVGYLNKYPPILSFIQATKDLGYDVTVMAAGDNSNIENYPGYDFTGVKAVDVIGEYESDLLELTMPSAGMRTYRTGRDANQNPIEYSTHIIPGKKCTMVFDHEK